MIPPPRLLLFRLFQALFLLPVFLFSSERAEAQQKSQRVRQIQQQVLDEYAAMGLLPEGTLDEILTQKVEFEYGASFRFAYYTWFDIENHHNMRITDVRLWGDLVYQNMHQLYARVMGTWTDYGAGSEYYYDEENDANFPRLDVGYYRLELTRFLGVEDPLGRLRFKAGRDYFRLGTGLLLDKRGDGGILEYTAGNLHLNAFIERSIYSEDMGDRSYPDFGHNKRLFSGIEVGNKFAFDAWNTPTSFDFFGYALWQRFLNDREFTEFPDAAGQKFGDDTRNLGAGVKGEVGTGLAWSLEYILQRGDTYSDGSTERTDIDAYAYGFTTEYVFRTVHSLPTFTFQYIYGSGDPDAGNTLDTIGGNQAGTDYKAFTPYGYVDTGVAFFPQISNMLVYKFGASCSPFEKGEGCADLQVGANYFIYQRAERMGGISDRYTVPGERNLGHEIDVYLQWRPFTDVSVLVQYGLFDPNRDAFDVGSIVYF